MKLRRDTETLASVEELAERILLGRAPEVCGCCRHCSLDVHCDEELDDTCSCTMTALCSEVPAMCSEVQCADKGLCCICDLEGDDHQQCVNDACFVHGRACCDIAGAQLSWLFAFASATKAAAATSGDENSPPPIGPREKKAARAFASDRLVGRCHGLTPEEGALARRGLSQRRLSRLRAELIAATDRHAEAIRSLDCNCERPVSLLDVDLDEPCPAHRHQQATCCDWNAAYHAWTLATSRSGLTDFNGAERFCGPLDKFRLPLLASAWATQQASGEAAARHFSTCPNNL